MRMYKISKCPIIEHRRDGARMCPIAGKVVAYSLENKIYDAVLKLHNELLCDGNIYIHGELNRECCGDVKKIKRKLKEKYKLKFEEATEYQDIVNKLLISK